MKAELSLCVILALAQYALSKHPNVILMYADDMGRNDLGYVNSEVLSPNLDALAKGGVILENNYVMDACTPTRHCLMTSRYPYKTQMSHMVLMPTQAHCTPTDITFLPQRFKNLGYNTYMTGKWHLGLCQEACLPTSRGFDHFYGYWQGEQDYFKHTTSGGYDWRDGTDLDRTNAGTFNTFLVNDWLEKQFADYDDENPFFLYLAWPNVHSPISCPEVYKHLYDDNDDISDTRKDYLGVLYAMDEAVGNFTTLLKDNGLYDNTIIVFSSDNGGVHGGASSNLPYRASKTAFYEGGVRALSFVNSPLLPDDAVGTTREGLMFVTDWAPTLFSWIGESIGDDADILDGYDQTDMILHGGDSARDEIIFNIDMLPMPMMGQAALRSGDYKFIWGSPGATDGYGDNIEVFYDNPTNLEMIGLDPSTIKHSTAEERALFDFSPEFMAIMTAIDAYWGFNASCKDTGLVNLFDLKNDPYEYTNLGYDPDYAETVSELKDKVLGLLDGYVPAPWANRQQRSAGDPSNFNGAWSTGWCEDLDIVMDTANAKKR